jgi:hypothetical protein
MRRCSSAVVVVLALCAAGAMPLSALAGSPESDGLPTVRQPGQAAASAPASEHRVTYDLSLAGASIGTRQVTVRFRGNRRIVEVVTDASVAGVRTRSRSTGVFGGAQAGFTTVVEDAAGSLAVQGTEIAPGRWLLVTTDAAGTRERTVDATLSSVQLHDPDAARFVTSGGALSLLVVETGEVVRGNASEPSYGRMSVGGADVGVADVRVQAEGASARFAFDDAGNLLRSELGAYGAVVVATARTLPPARSFGAVETLERLGVQTTEESL